MTAQNADSANASNYHADSSIEAFANSTQGNQYSADVINAFKTGAYLKTPGGGYVRAPDGTFPNAPGADPGVAGFHPVGTYTVPDQDLTNLVNNYTAWKASQANSETAFKSYATAAKASPGRDENVLFGPQANPAAVIGAFSPSSTGNALDSILPSRGRQSRG